MNKYGKRKTRELSALIRKVIDEGHAGGAKFTDLITDVMCRLYESGKNEKFVNDNFPDFIEYAIETMPNFSILNYITKEGKNKSFVFRNGPEMRGNQKLSCTKCGGTVCKAKR